MVARSKAAILAVLVGGGLVGGAAPKKSKSTKPAPAPRAASVKKPAKAPKPAAAAAVAAKPQAPLRLPALRSSSAIVVDQRTGQVLVEKKGDAVMPIASITKLMTAMVVLDAGQSLQEELQIESGDKDRLRNSHSRLAVGTRLTRGEALQVALVASDNRAAHALGRTYPGGLEACVTAMNAKARALGLEDALFADPTGLDGNNVASAKDLARLVDAAHRYPVIRDFSTMGEVEIGEGRRKVAFMNTNGLVRNPRWDIGLSKTGYLSEAGKCLVMQTMMANRPVVIVLLESWGRYTRLGDAARIKQWLEAEAKAAGGRAKG